MRSIVCDHEKEAKKVNMPIDVCYVVSPTCSVIEYDNITFPPTYCAMRLEGLEIFKDV